VTSTELPSLYMSPQIPKGKHETVETITPMTSSLSHN
jgi:hypothetical protein